MLKDVIGYEGIYQIDEFGNVYSLERKVVKHDGFRTVPKTILRKSKDKNGYIRMTLSKNGIRKKYSLHRLLALAFIKNANNKTCINHIDGDKLNNSLTNLEWVSRSENTKHALCVLNKKFGLKGELGTNWYIKKGVKAPACKTVLMLDKSNNIIQEFQSVTDAGKFLNKSTAQITHYLKGIRNNRFYNFKYKKQELC